MRHSSLRRGLRVVAVATFMVCGGVPAGSFAATDFTSVWAGVDHTCAVTPAGAAECWGQNDADQSDDRPGPFSQVSAGGLHNCALTTDGAAECWGDNGYGESNDHPGPFVQVVAGWMHTCGLTTGGAADCWGLPDDGQAKDRQRQPRRTAGSAPHDLGAELGEGRLARAYLGPPSVDRSRVHRLADRRASNAPPGWEAGPHDDDLYGGPLRVQREDHARDRRQCRVRRLGVVRAGPFGAAHDGNLNRLDQIRGTPRRRAWARPPRCRLTFAWMGQARPVRSSSPDLPGQVRRFR